MFCENCGTKLDDDAKFCTSCGVNIIEGTNKIKNVNIENNDVLFSVKPVFKALYKILGSQFLYLIILSTISGVFFGMAFEYSYLSMLSILVSGIIIIAYILLQKEQYNNYKYDLYKTKVVYIDGFINKVEKEIKYKHIKEITMKQNIIQRYFGIGTIILHTTSTNVANSKENAANPFKNGIYILDIEDVDNIYKKIKEIINI